MRKHTICIFCELGKHSGMENCNSLILNLSKTCKDSSWFISVNADKWADRMFCLFLKITKKTTHILILSETNTNVLKFLWISVDFSEFSY